MLNGNSLYTLTPEQEAQADAVEALIDEGIQEGLAIDDETKKFSFKTAELAKSIKKDHGVFQVRVRKTVIERCKEANWKVEHDEAAGTITLTAKRPRKARTPKTDADNAAPGDTE